MEEKYVERASARLDSIARLDFGFYPTPIEEAPRLRAALGPSAPRIFIKRDDYTGAGFGGNKVRKLEYVLAQAAGAQAAITIGGERSNHARATAMLCARLGLRCILVLNAQPGAPKSATRLVDELAGAEIHLVGSRDERRARAQAIADDLQGRGVRVAQIPLGASTPLGALGYVRAVRELAGQIDRLNLRPDCIFLASSSGGTQAGLLAGCRIFGMEDVQIIGVSPDDPASSIAASISTIIGGIPEMLGLPPDFFDGEARVVDDYIGPGYGLDSVASKEALALVARCEGVLLDPVYTAKTMAALIDSVRKGRFGRDDTVLFWHTGGQLAMFTAPL